MADDKEEDEGSTFNEQGFAAGMALFAAGIMLMFFSILVGFILLMVW